MREIRKLYLFTFFRSLTFFSAVSIAFYCDNDLTYFQIMFLQTIYGLATALMELPSGVLSDLVGRKTTLIIGTVSFLFAYLLGSIGTSMTPFCIMQILAAAGQSCYSGTFASLMYEDVKASEDVEKSVNVIFANMQSINIIAVLLASLTSSIIVRYANMRCTYYFTVIAYMVTLIIAILLSDAGQPNILNSNRVSVYKDEVVKSIKIIKYNGIAAIMIDMVIVASFVNTFSYMQQPILISNGLDVEYLGIVTFIITVGTVLMLKIMPKIEKKITETGITLFTLIGLLVVMSNAIVKNYIWNSVSFLAITIIIRYRDIILTNKINSYIENDARATTMSIISAVQMIVLAIMSIIIGKIEDISIYNAVLLLSCVTIILYLIIIVFLKKTRIKESQHI